ncbi:MAG TPA: hypothetical protein VJS42_04950 [Steroidobacteraceae bacterium]|nr:hypothetical protein [Steroidobacteraceae bacterium]
MQRLRLDTVFDACRIERAQLRDRNLLRLDRTLKLRRSAAKQRMAIEACERRIGA